MPDTPNQEEQGATLLKIIQAAAISPADAAKVVANLRKRQPPRRGTEDEYAYSARVSEAVADRLVSRYSKLAATSGGVTALAGVIPGVGTILAAVGGGAADTAVCMKLQVDMCMCMAAAFGWDLTREDARHLAFLIALGGTLEKAGVEVGVQVGSKAGVKLLRQYLTGAVLQTLKAFFRQIGLVFSRAALERALPFGIGVVVGSSADYALTRYVGAQAKKWFIIDRETAREPPPSAAAA